MLVRMSVRECKGISNWLEERKGVVYCGRGGRFENRFMKGSVLSNKYKEFGKKKNIELYRRWLWNEICEMNFEVIDELIKILEWEKELGLVVLVCWCGEGDCCHCDVILSCLLWMKGGDNEPPPNPQNHITIQQTYPDYRTEALRETPHLGKSGKEDTVRRTKKWIADHTPPPVGAPHRRPTYTGGEPDPMTFQEQQQWERAGWHRGVEPSPRYQREVVYREKGAR